MKFLFKAHDSDVTAIEILANGYIVSTSSDQDIKIWNYTTGSVIYSKANAHGDKIEALKVLKNGDFATADSESFIKIWSGRDYSLIKTLNANSDNINVLEVLSSGVLVSGSNNVIFWDVATGNRLKTINPLSPVTCLKETSDGMLFIGGNTKKLAYYDGKSTFTIENALQASNCNGLSLFNDTYLIVAQSSNSIDIYDVSLTSNPVRSSLINLGAYSNRVESLRKILIIYF